jgi:hypothetical protein
VSAQEIVTGDDTPIVAQEYAPGQLLVRFAPSVGAQRRAQVLAEHGLSPIGQIQALRVRVLRLPPGQTVERAMARLNRLPEVELAEPNYILSIAEIDDQWGLQQIEAPEAWSATTYPGTPIVAVLDTGVDYNHPELIDNVWTNPGEIPGNSTDDDGNGYVDDVRGWDYVNNDNDPIDDHYHGTFVASVVAAARDNGDEGVAGVCPWCEVMPVKVVSSGGSGALDVVANGIIYATDNGADVINMSLGIAYPINPSTVLEDAVNYAWNNGTVVVAAAGNDAIETGFYPAAYDNAIGVTSTNLADFRSCFSNWGTWVDVAAPGSDIPGAVPGGGYGTGSGTSLASPHVAGEAALLFSQDPDRTNDTVRTILETTVEDLGPPGQDSYFGSGRVNALRAVSGTMTPTTPPAGAFTTDVSASGYAHARKLVRDASGMLHLVWHSPEGGQYRVLHTTSSDDGASWSAPEEIFGSSSATYHVAVTVDNNDIHVAFPTTDQSTLYRVFYTRKSLSGGDWSEPVSVMGGSYNAVRPDLFVDPSNGTLHLVGSSFDDRNYVYYSASIDGGANWSAVAEVFTGNDPVAGTNFNSRYATVYANGSNVYIAGRTFEPVFFGLLAAYRVFTIYSTDGGDTWTLNSALEVPTDPLVGDGDYGLSMAGVQNSLYLAYEYKGNILFRTSQGDGAWSAPTTLEAGAWPTITQAADGRAWAMWVQGGQMRSGHYNGTTWEPAEAVGGGEYPNLKLGVSGNMLEWTATHCSGAPYRLITVSQTISVSPGNQPPTASDDGYDTDEDTLLTVAVPGVLGNDDDLDGDPLSALLENDVSNGTLVLNANGSFDYLPNPDFNGPDSFTYKANDGTVDSNVATVTLTVNAVNDAPLANNVAAAGEEDTVIDWTPVVSDAEGDLLTCTIVQPASNGTAFVAPDCASGTYAPGVNFNGPDTFSYKANDSLDDSNVATVTITVNPVNDAPVADNVAAGGDEDTVIDWTPVVSDAENNSLTCTIVQPASNGTAFVAPDCASGTYTPGLNLNGPDSFTYKANDGTVDSNVATVTLTVNAVNDPPVVTISSPADGAAFNLGDTITFTGSAADVEDGDVSAGLSWQSDQDSVIGAGTPVSTSTLSSGVHTITATAADGLGLTGSAQITITVDSLHVADLDGSTTPARGSKWNATVTITVLDTGGTGISGATVDGSWSGGVNGGASCTTDDSGRCSVTKNNVKSNVSSVTFTVDTVSHATLAYGPGDNDDPDGDSDGTSIVVYKDGPPPPPGSIAGTVINSDGGSPISGATVTADTGESTFTLADGTYLLSNVPSGVRTVTVSASGYVTQQKETSVDSNATVTLDFALVAESSGGGTGTVRGRVVDGSGRNLGGVLVVDVDSTQSATTNNGGRYTINDVPEGSRTVTATIDGFACGPSQSQPVLVEAGQTTTVNFTCP